MQWGYPVLSESGAVTPACRNTSELYALPRGGFILSTVTAVDKPD